MQRRTHAFAWVFLMLSWGTTSRCGLAEEYASPDEDACGTSAGYWSGEETAAEAWARGELSIVAGSAPLPIEELMWDPAVAGVQFQSPPTSGPGSRTPVRLAQRTPPRRTLAAGGIASTPYMIGDTGGGTCLGLSGALSATLSHPTLTCSRLNVSEANSPVPTDRIYYSYRHFNNASRVMTYQFSEFLDVDQHTVAWEKTFWGGTGSVELRLPLEYRLRSDIFSIVAPGSSVVDPLVAPDGGYRTELGNCSAIFKMLLLERPDFAVSGGLGVTLPTAEDVDYRVAAQGIVGFPNAPGFTADTSSVFHLIFANETVYLAPFMAWVVAPQRARWFHQGFMQVEVAANPSRVTAYGVGANDFYQDNAFVGFFDYVTPTPARVDLFAQTLLRLNLGTGYALIDNPQGDWLHRLSALFELHYTSTLEDANLTDIPLSTLGAGGNVPQTITVGNQKNRIDLLNAAVGVSAQSGSWVVTNGVICPLRERPDRAFDFEYNLQVQRLF